MLSGTEFLVFSVLSLAQVAVARLARMAAQIAALRPPAGDDAPPGPAQTGS